MRGNLPMRRWRAVAQLQRLFEEWTAYKARRDTAIKRLLVLLLRERALSGPQTGNHAENQSGKHPSTTSAQLQQLQDHFPVVLRGSTSCSMAST